MNRCKLFSILIALSLILITIPITIEAVLDEWAISEVDEDCFWATYLFDDTDLVYLQGDDMRIIGWYLFEGPDVLKAGYPISEAYFSVMTTGTEIVDPDAHMTLYGVPTKKGGAQSYLDDQDQVNGPYTASYVNVNLSSFVGNGVWHNITVTNIVKEINQHYYFYNGHNIAFVTLSPDNADAERYVASEESGHAAKLYVHYKTPDPEDPEYPPDLPDDVEWVDEYRNYTIWVINGTWDGLDGWSFRREIDISGCALNLTDFQVKIDLGMDIFPALPENAPTYQNTPTSDASNQTVHPSILYFPNGWNGYKYWMAITPYPGGVDDKETPEILACNDGESWEVPNGLTNPIVARDAANPNTDPCLFYNEATDELWVYYRKISAGVYSRLYLKKSSDGVDWSGTGQGTLVLASAPGFMMSPAVEKVGDTYYLWYIRTDGTPNTLKRRTSADGESWSGESTQNIYGFMPSGKEPWHFEIRYIEEYDVYWMLLTVTPIGVSGAGSILTFARSVDGVNWYLHNEIFLNKGTGGNWDDNTIYKATAILTDSDFKIWYSARKAAGGLWHTGYTNTTITLSSLQMISAMKDDLGDVRFTTDDEKTEIPYYIDLPALTAWVKVPSILAIPDNATIYMYYGNPTATTTSNGTDTFIDFEPMDNLTLFDERFDKKLGDNRVLDNSTYTRTTIKLPDTDGGGSTGYNATISWSTNSTYIFEYYFGATAVGGCGYPYGGFFGRGNNGAINLWVAGPLGSGNQNQLYTGASYVFGVHEEDTLRQWQVIINGTSRTVLNVLVDDGDEYTTDRAFGAAFDPDGLQLDAVGTVPTGDGWFGTWWIRQYCSLQPETEEWGENETSVDPYYIVTDPNGTVVETWNGENCTTIDCIKDDVDDDIGYPDPEDPNPSGWEDPVYWSIHRFKLLLFLIGMILLVGSPVYGFSARPEAATWIILMMNMIIGVALLWSLQTM